MAYDKTRTYLNLKRLADRAYVRAVASGTDLDWETASEYELECADYAYMNEAEIDWTHDELRS